MASNSLKMHGFILAALVGLVAGEAKLSLLTDAAKTEGAICLDGTPGGYYYRQGMNSGASNWIIHQEGGGWCYNEDLCLERSKTSLGSSTFWGPTASFNGFLSDEAMYNPQFYNWNVVYLKYCDGASFSGNKSDGVVVNGTTIHFRGKRILKAALDDLWNSKGMKNAKEVILTGCSAGGLATYLHADYVRSYLPSTVSLKALADAGYFLDTTNWLGQQHIRPLYQYVFKMQNCMGGVNQDCIAANKGEEWKCFFAQYTFPHIKIPFFQQNSLYDTWQLGNILQLNCTPPKCPTDEEEAFLGYRDTFLNADKAVLSSQISGAFLPACLQHCMSLSNFGWVVIKVNDSTAYETFAKWYNGNGKLHEVDCAYPCNKSCP